MDVVYSSLVLSFWLFSFWQSSSAATFLLADDFYGHVCRPARLYLTNCEVPSIWVEAILYNENLILTALFSGRARDSSASRAVSFLVDVYHKWDSELKV